MNVVKDDFNNRVAELRKYLRAIESLEGSGVSLFVSGRRRKVDSDLPKIMKAAFFLMVYNLVESSVASSFRELYAAINAKNQPIDKFRKEYRALWMAQKFKGKDPVGANQKTYRDLVAEMVAHVIDKNSVVFDHQKLSVSGNIDAQKARELLEDHAILYKAPPTARGGSELLMVKTKRNALAHGDISFSECGRDFTVSDLKAITDQSVVFLRSLIRSVEKFINASNYST